jgi:hypothetical protein
MNINPYKTSTIKLLLKVCGHVLLVILPSASPLAQTDSTSSEASKKTRINIIRAAVIERNPEISNASRLIGNVKLAFDDAILICDSAYRFDDGRFEVFSQIVISQEPTTELRSNYGVLNPDIGAVEIKGDVTFNHEELRISCPSLTYNLDTKRVSYYERAIIIEGDRHLSSNLGVYSYKTNRLYVGGNVEIVELKDIIQSDSLSIDRNSKTLRLYKSSHLEIGEAD